MGGEQGQEGSGDQPCVLRAPSRKQSCCHGFEALWGGEEAWHGRSHVEAVGQVQLSSLGQGLVKARLM